MMGTSVSKRIEETYHREINDLILEENYRVERRSTYVEQFG